MDALNDVTKSDTSQDAPASNDATPDGPAASDSSGSDVTQSLDATTNDVTDAGSTPDVGPEASSSCPGSQPANNTTCPASQVPCDYGDGGITCICHVVSAGVRQWSCTGVEGGTGPSCPIMRPKPEDAGQYAECTDGGASFSCRYGNTWCFCNEGLSTNNIWSCL